MAERVTIEVEAKLIDNLTAGLLKAAQIAEKLKKDVESIGKTGSVGSNSGTANNVAKSAHEAEKAIKKVDNAAKSLNTNKYKFHVDTSNLSKVQQAVEKVKSSAKQLTSGKHQLGITAKDNASATLGLISSKAKSLISQPYDMKLGIKDNASDKLGTIVSKAKAFIGGNYTANFGAKDNASNTLGNIIAQAKTWANNAWSAVLNAKDNASHILGNIGGQLKSLAGKSWDIVVNLKDRVTSGLSKLFSLPTMLQTALAGAATGYVAKQGILDPIALADQMTNASIGFETMFNSKTLSDKMMKDIKQYAKVTPFDTTGTISAVQQMIRAGWSQDTVLADMEKIGNTAAAAGQGTAGVQGIVMALQQMKMAGRVNAQDMMQLTNRGVEAWKFLADGMGVSVQEVRKLSEDGAIAADEAIGHIMKGMEKYNGMMDKMSNRTVSGIWSNLKDTFEIGIIEKWGNGLQKAATTGLGKLVDYLDKIDPALQKAGTSIEKIGNALGTWAFDKLESAGKKFMDVFGSDEFKNADGTLAKIKVAWKQLVSEPLGKWFKDKSLNLADWLGEKLGGGASNLLQMLFGKDMSEIDGMATSIAGRFIESFKKAFQGADVMSALGDGIKKMFKSAGKLLPGGDSPTLGSFLSAGLLMKLIGGPAGAMFKGLTGVESGGSILGSSKNGTGLLGLFRNSGQALFGGGSLLSSGTATALGAGAAIGGTVGVASLVSGINNLYKSTKTLDETNKKQLRTKGILKTAGTLLGAGIGFVAGGPGGAMIGAGIGGGAGSGLGSWTDTIYEAGTGFKNFKENLYGSKAALNLSTGAAMGAGVGALGGVTAAPAAAIGAGVNYVAGLVKGLWEDKVTAKKTLQDSFSSQEMKDAVVNKELTKSEKDEIFARAVKQNLQDHFGNITLTLDEIQVTADNIVYGNQKAAYEKYANAAADVQSNYQNLQSAAYNLEKQNWKTNATLGIKMTDDEKTSYKDTVDSYINSAKDYVESQHYQFDAAVDILIKDSDKAANYKTISKDFYGGLQKDLDSKTEKLNAQIDIALEDGKITVDEQKTITDLQSEIQQMLDDISDAEMEAEMSALKIKFGEGTLDTESFSAMLQQLSTSSQGRLDQAKDAYVDVYSNAKVMLEKGEIDQNQFNEMVQSAAEGYQAVIDEVSVKIQKFGFDNLATAYKDDLDGALGNTADEIATNMQKKLEEAFANPDINPKQWTAEDIQKWFGLDQLNLDKETLGGITEKIQEIINSTPDGFKGKFKISLEPETDGATGDIGAKIKEMLGGDEPVTVDKVVKVLSELDVNSEEAGSINEKLKEQFESGEPLTIEKLVSIMTNTEIKEGDLGDTGDINARLKEQFESGEPLTVEKLISILVNPQVQEGGDSGVDEQVKNQIESNPVSAEQPVTVTPKPQLLPSWTPNTAGLGNTILPAQNTTVDVNVTPKYNVSTSTPAPTIPDIPAQTKTANVTVEPNYTVTAKELTVPELSASTTANVSVATTYTETTTPTFGPYTGDATASVSISATYTEVTKPTFGPYSASATANVSITANYSVTNPNPNVRGMINVPGNATGGFVSGKQLSWVGEEGPEAIIPLVPGRRGRGIDLWEKAGRMLGVLEHAEGGVVGGTQKPMPKAMPKRQQTNFSSDSGEGSKATIDVGGVQIIVQGENGQSLSEIIESNSEAIAEQVARIFRQAARKSYANSSARV